MAKESYQIMALSPNDATSVLEKDMGGAKTTSQKASKPARVRIILEESDDIPPTGLFVGLNGTGYLLRPGEEVDVPAGVIEVLEQAVMAMPQIDPQTNQVVGWRQRMRYPFRRMG